MGLISYTEYFYRSYTKSLSQDMLFVSIIYQLQYSAVLTSSEYLEFCKLILTSRDKIGKIIVVEYVLWLLVGLLG
jgi:hypothetical protein